MNNEVGFRLLVVYIIFSGLVFFTVIRWFASPRVNGRPILLLPEVKAIEDYRRQAVVWDQEMTLLDGEINALINNNPSDLFSQSQQAQTAFEHGLRIAQAIDVQEVPPPLVGVKDQFTVISGDYLDAARLVLRWIGTSDQNYFKQIQVKLAAARSGLKTMEGSQWLEMK